MRCPADHEKYYTQPEAQDALRRLIDAAKRTGLGGRSWKRLNVFPCGNHWHVGRSNTLQASYSKPASEPKPASAAELRRKANREAKAAERQLQHRLRQVDALGSLADMADSLAIAARMVQALFQKAQ